MAHAMQFSCDDETGEVLTYEVNEETGEPCLGSRSPPPAPLAPSAPSAQHADERNTHPTPEKQLIVFPQNGYMCHTKKFQSLKANIISGSNIISHRLLLLPTLIFYPALFCSMLSILEVYLHICCHKKNRKLDDPNLYYRSPFHMISSMFCGVCRDIDSASKIGQLQDKRRIRYDYFRSIAI